jgi:RHS repeat-associated protein
MSLLTKGILLIIALTFTVMPNSGWAYNKSWDQGHKCVQGIPGKSGWCKWDYDGNPADCDASSPECCELYCKICPVFAYTGRYQKTYTDLKVPGVGPTLAITRTYNSQEWSSSLFGYNWTFNFGRRLIIARNKNNEKIIGVLLQTGENNYYREEIDGTLIRLTGYGAKYELIKNYDNTYAIMNLDGTVYELREDGKIGRIVDKNKNEMVFTYNSVGCISRITNASGNYVDFQLAPNGKISSISDNLGRKITYGYDENGNLTSVTDPLGNTSNYVYNSKNLLLKIIDAKGNVVEIATYDNNQPPRVSTFMEKGETYSIAYFDGKTEKTDSQGNKWTYYFNDVGVIEKVVDPLGNVTNQQLNKIIGTSIDWEKDANGNQTTYTYDSYGNIMTKTDPLGNTWSYTYLTGTDLLETETNPIGVITKYVYDINGNRIAVLMDFGGSQENVTTYTYDVQGNQLSVTDPLGNKTTYEYDTYGNLIRENDPLGNVTTYTYDKRGNRLTRTDAIGNTIVYNYDLMDHLVSVVDANGNTTSFQYDANGNMVSETDAIGNYTTFTFDTYNRLVKITNAADNEIFYSYDTRDNLIAFTDANGTITQYEYDILNRLVRVINALNETVNYTYDANGNLLSIKDGNSNYTSFSYDNLNRRKMVAYSDNTQVSYNYDTIGNLISQTDAKGSIITFNYDRLNRLKRKTFPDGQITTFTYDALGRMISGANQNSLISYSYNANGKVISVTQNDKTLSYEYDKVGNRTIMALPEGEVVNYTYNDLNLMNNVFLSNGKGVRYTYDKVYQIIRKDYSGGAYSTINYDNIGRPIEISHFRFDETYIYTERNIFDNAGSILTKSYDVDQSTYTYDMVHRLTGVSHPGGNIEVFSYDPAGNRISSRDHSDWSYNNRNQLVSYNGVEFTYDNNGSMITKTGASGVTQYVYDYENQLIRIEFPDGSYAAYKYDVLGRRIQKDFNGIVTKFIYDRNWLLSEYDGAGDLQRTYLRGVADTTPSFLYDGSEVYFMHHDHLGTSNAISNENGDLLWVASYKGFGEATVNVENIMNNLRYAGQYFDKESGLHYNYFRYYYPSIGRYIVDDPIGFAGGINTYVYAQSNPTNKFDKLGLWSGADRVLVWHFYFGGGAYKDISRWCGDYLADVAVMTQTQILKRKIDYEVKKLSIRKFNGSKTFSINQSSSLYITKIYSFGSGNHHNQRAACNAKGDGCCVSGSCKLLYTAKDLFDDPVDLCQGWGFCGDVRNLLGSPFWFGLSCGGSYSSQSCN